MIEIGKGGQRKVVAHFKIKYSSKVGQYEP
jgi:hypothetical protein